MLKIIQEGRKIMYTLSKIETYQGAIEVLELLDDKLKYYWLSSLKLSDSVKGMLLLYFNLY